MAAELFEKHDQIAIKLRLPLAPTANNLKAIRELPGRKPFLVPSTAYNAYKKQVKRCWWVNPSTPSAPITARLRVSVTVCYRDRRCMDVENFTKGMLDALTEAGAWLDDSQIDELHVFRGPIAPPAGYCDVTIEAI